VLVVGKSDYRTVLRRHYWTPVTLGSVVLPLQGLQIYQRIEAATAYGHHVVGFPAVAILDCASIRGAFYPRPAGVFAEFVRISAENHTRFIPNCVDGVRVE
jgi:hypothetical protein